MIPKASARLAKLFILRKNQADAALSLDGYERWGRGSNYPEQEADQALANGSAKTEKQMTASIKKLRKTEPEALEYFIQGQFKLLDAIINTDKDSTSVFVAKQERLLWEEVRAGTRDFARSNPYYIREDPALFEEIFGFAPRDTTKIL